MLTKLGKYEIKSELGRGAMGIVYEGFDPFIERTVAIKTIQKSLIDKSEVQEVFGRFRREAQAAGRLSHPNIVSVYEYGEEGDMAFIAMELIIGVELKDHFDTATPFEISESASIMTQLLDALEYSHIHGVVHRDIKPSNILITQDGQVKIADFGIAKIESSDLTQAGTVLGTPTYMSPEQFMGIGVDRRTDIYSAGVILYQFLTGAKPFIGSNMTVVMHKVMNELPVLPSKLDTKIPEAFNGVVMKAMSKRPEDRFQTAAEFKQAFKSAIASAVPRTKTSSLDATVKVANAVQEQQGGDIDQDSSIDFSMEDFEKRLGESLLEVTRESSEPITPRKGEPPDTTFSTISKALSAASTPGASPTKPAELGESGLLAGLAREAKERSGTIKSTVQNNQAPVKPRIHAHAQFVDAALTRIHKFFNAFVQHVNGVEPTINRTYRLDARAIYANLKWHGAKVEYRKQSFSEGAFLDFVTFTVDLCAPEPVLLKRTWNQLETLEDELEHLGLRVIDDLEAIRKKAKQELLEARLAPNFPVQIKFQGNYEKGCIDVTSRNIEVFGAATFKLEPGGVTPGFMDEIGLYLLGRTNKLPEALRRI